MTKYKLPKYKCNKIQLQQTTNGTKYKYNKMQKYKNSKIQILGVLIENQCIWVGGGINWEWNQLTPTGSWGLRLSLAKWPIKAWKEL